MVAIIHESCFSCDFDMCMSGVTPYVNECKYVCVRVFLKVCIVLSCIQKDNIEHKSVKRLLFIVIFLTLIYKASQGKLMKTE